MSAAAPLLDVRDLVKDYQALRPLRIKALTLSKGDILAIHGLDEVGARTFVHVVTGATLPDTGDVALFGQNTGPSPTAPPGSSRSTASAWSPRAAS